ncbi:MAG TPA: MFS transporter [Acidimicrobiia bacterium]|nr:MFS transporter [Acidimicrobiia bacterium]
MRRSIRATFEIVAPSRLGRNFRWLLGSSWLTNLSDGIALAAGPLLVASQTRDPRLVSFALLVQWLPPLLFGLYAGVLADRLDRRRLIIVVNLVRSLLLAVLATFVATGRAGVAMVLVALFVLGVAETFSDTTTSTLLPMMVGKGDLGLANARLMTGLVTANQLAGPPLGAFMFAVGMAQPFAAQAMIMAMAVVMVSHIVTTVPETRPDQSLRREIAQGAGWLWNHPPMRTLALTILTFNVTFGAAWSILVLYATDRLGMGEVGFGLLTTVMAVGGLLGTAVYTQLEARFSLANIMRGGLVIETITHLCLALTTTPAVAMVMLFFFGAHAFVWGTTSTAVRQRAVPNDLQGRVGSVYRLAVTGGLVLGAPIGGLVAGRWGLEAPFWFAFAGSAVILVLIWRALDQIAHVGEP